MKTNIENVTDLDFYTIKDNLIAHFKKENSPFKDWDFKGSGLNQLLDVLAYNTHYNAINAHLAMNETFLDSAQIRSNVVSRAKTLGYTPRSNRGATAVIDIEFSRLGDSSATVLVLPRGSKFTTTIDSKTYVFTTLAEYTTDYDGESFKFKNVLIHEGRFTTEKFVVNTNDLRRVFKIKERNVDTSTLRVKVYPHTNTPSFELYLSSDNFSSYTPTSNVYFITEDYDGFFQLEFGDGVIGKRLENLQLIEIEYLTTTDRPQDSNSISRFKFGGVSNSIFNSVIQEVEEIRVVNIAAGGEPRETMNTIRRNAPLAFMAQDRAVTVSDYEALIRKNISGLDAISVWGGQDSNPPQYGKVFIAAKPNNALFLTEFQKGEILDYLNSIKILTVKPEIIDPTYLYLFFDIVVKYNPDLTTLTGSEIANAVRSEIELYNVETLGSFEKTFKYSKFLSMIDGVNDAITNSFARVFAYKILPLSARGASPQKLDFKFRLLGRQDQREPVISSTGWKFGGRTLYLSDEPIENSDLRRVYAYTISGSDSRKTKIIRDLGTVNIQTGVLDLAAIPSTFDTTIQVMITPAATDLNTIREQLLTIDFGRTNITPETDNTRTTTILRD